MTKALLFFIDGRLSELALVPGVSMGYATYKYTAGCNCTRKYIITTDSDARWCAQLAVDDQGRMAWMTPVSGAAY
jgi:hypothetical protein